VATLTAEFAENKGDTVALVDDEGTRTWAELDERINRLANGLRDRGLGVGDTLAIIAGNRREWFEVTLACAHIGVTFVPVNWHCVAEEIAYVLGDSGAKAVVTDDRFAEVVIEALDDPRTSDVTTRLITGTEGRGPLDGLDALVAASSAEEPADQSLGGPMFYTSGTTGHPKGVRSSLTSGGGAPVEIYQLVGASFGDYVPIPGVTALCGPVYHSAQWAFSWLPVIGGSSVVMQHKYDSAHLLELIDRWQVTNVHLVPTQLKRLLDLPDDVRKAFDGSSLQSVLHGAAPCPPAVKQQMIDWWGPVITEYYGSTEGQIITTCSSEQWMSKGGSVGPPVSTMEIYVVAEDGTRLGPDEDGTLYFRNVMGTDFEYHNAPEKTDAAHLEPGVFTTGDVGHLDEDGYLWLSSRKIDMIISGGVNIYPAEIEGVLGGHPDVGDVAVIGIPNEEFGEEVKAVVVLRPGVGTDAETKDQLLAQCREHLAGYKVPRSIDFASELPRTGTGKIKKADLREPYWAGEDRSI
jgi:long-chain acyl-CoA synthetase